MRKHFSRRILIFTLVIMLFHPSSAVGLVCSDTGYTVIFVNGILNEIEKARKNSEDLQKKVGITFNGEPLVVRFGHNQSHIAGLADFAQSVGQIFDNPISYYDRDTILRQIHSEVTTRKILLVGHSQGTFYTNEIFRYLTEHGVPRESIAVYNLATPASYVAGSGNYLTSANDQLVLRVRKYTVAAGAPEPLPSNILIPISVEDSRELFGGHSFSGAYLAGASARIVKDIEKSLSVLKASDTSVTDGCFTPPPETISDKTQQALLNVLDPASQNVVAGVVSMGQAVAVATQKAYAAASSASAAIASTISNVLGKTQSNVSAASQASAAASAVTQPSLLSVQTKSASSNSPPALQTSAEISPPTPTSTEPEKPQTDPAPIQDPLETTPQTSDITPSFGGGSPTVGTNSSATSVPSSVPLSLSILSPADNALFATTSITFTGTTTASAFVSSAFGTTFATTSTDSSNAWTFTFTLSEGTTTVSFSAATSSEATATSTRAVSVDTTPTGATTVSIPACNSSLVVGHCIVATTSVSVLWSDVSGASYYAFVRNGTLSATSTATTSRASVDTNATTTLTVVSYDAAGNAATSSSRSVAVIVQPLIINEIGWGGDNTSASNQWIELKNISSYTLDLSHIAIARGSSAASIQLSGTLPPQTDNYVVVEPTNISFTGSRKLVTPFSALPTSGEQLSLVWNASTTIDATPATATCASWCAGAPSNTALGSNLTGLQNLYSALSMERKLNTSDGTLAANWQNTDSYGPWIGSGGALWGTPGIANSEGLPASGVYCGASSNLVVASSSFNPGTSDCTYLSRFITGDTFGVARFGGLFRGVVASSTGGGNPFFKALAASLSATISNPQAGENLFFAIWEKRTGPAYDSDTSVFNSYFRTGIDVPNGITGPPHSNYVVIPFTYAAP